MPAQSRLLVAGLGNLLLRDDGIGVHVVQDLQDDPPPGTLAVEIGTAVLDALHLLEAVEHVLAIDAMRAGGPPGTLYTCAIDDIAPDHRTSLHELSLVSALRFLPEGRRPRVTVLGVEPEVIDYGMELSPALQQALPQVIAAARSLSARLVAGSGRHLRPPA
jgi:hydrogenase maturation protease